MAVFNFELTTALAEATVLRIVDLTPLVVAVVELAGLTQTVWRRGTDEIVGRAFDVKLARSDVVSLALTLLLATVLIERRNGSPFGRPVIDTDELERDSDGIDSGFGIADNDFLPTLPVDIDAERPI